MAKSRREQIEEGIVYAESKQREAIDRCELLVKRHETDTLTFSVANSAARFWGNALAEYDDELAELSRSSNPRGRR